MLPRSTWSRSGSSAGSTATTSARFWVRVLVLSSALTHRAERFERGPAFHQRTHVGGSADDGYDCHGDGRAKASAAATSTTSDRDSHTCGSPSNEPRTAMPAAMTMIPGTKADGDPFGEPLARAPCVPAPSDDVHDLRQRGCPPCGPRPHLQRAIVDHCAAKTSAHRCDLDRQHLPVMAERSSVERPDRTTPSVASRSPGPTHPSGRRTRARRVDLELLRPTTNHDPLGDQLDQ